MFQRNLITQVTVWKRDQETFEWNISLIGEGDIGISI